jgi:hypothetical protein
MPQVVRCLARTPVTMYVNSGATEITGKRYAASELCRPTAVDSNEVG